MGEETSVKDVLASIKKTNGMRDALNKSMGVDSGALIPDDIYFFDVSKEGYNHKTQTRFHGRCIEKGTEKEKSWGYIFTQVRHIKKTDTKHCGTKCVYCGEYLDKKANTVHVEKALMKYMEAKESAQLEKAIRDEWEAEQILLGRM